MLISKSEPESLSAEDFKAWRLRLEWTQAQAAHWLDVPVRTYQEWEQDRQRPQQVGPIRKLMAQADEQLRRASLPRHRS